MKINLDSVIRTQVEIELKRHYCIGGKVMWSLNPQPHLVKTKREALALCREMGWKVRPWK